MSSLLTAFGIDWHLLLTQGANFLVLAALLTWLLYKPVMNMAAERARVVAKGVLDAEEAARRLSAAAEEADARVNKAETEAADIVDVARQSANQEKTRIVKDAEARAAQVAADAEARAKEASAKALRESEKEVARMAVLAAAKVLRKE